MHNMFADCSNNSVSGCDPSGFRIVFEDKAEQRVCVQYTYIVPSHNSISKTITNPVKADIRLNITAWNGGIKHC